MTVIASCDDAGFVERVERALRASVFVTPPLKRETTMPTERRLPSGVPSSTV